MFYIDAMKIFGFASLFLALLNNSARHSASIISRYLKLKKQIKNQAIIPNTRNTKNPKKNAIVVAGVSGCLWASTSSSSVTRKRSAARPNERTVSMTVSVALLRMAVPTIAPIIIKKDIALTTHNTLKRDDINSDNSTEITKPKERSSKVSAAVKSNPSLAPAAKPIPIKNPSNKTSIETPASIAIGKALLSNGLASNLAVAILRHIMVAAPNPKPRTTNRGLCHLITSGKISTATTENTTPAAKCCKKLRIFGPGGEKSAIADPIIVAITGYIAKIKILSSLHSSNRSNYFQHYQVLGRDPPNAHLRFLV